MHAHHWVHSKHHVRMKTGRGVACWTVFRGFHTCLLKRKHLQTGKMRTGPCSLQTPCRRALIGIHWLTALYTGTGDFCGLWRKVSHVYAVPSGSRDEQLSPPVWLAEVNRKTWKGLSATSDQENALRKSEADKEDDKLQKQ